MDKPEDIIKLFKPNQAARLIVGDGADTTSIDQLLSDALEVGLIAAVTFATTGYLSGPFPASDQIHGGFGLIDYTTIRAARGLTDAHALSRADDVAAFRSMLMQPTNKADLQIHRDELARWVACMSLASDYQFAQSSPPGEQRSVAVVPSTAGLKTGEIAYAFRGIHFDQGKWMSNLQDPGKWLLTCRLQVGRRGNGGYESTWDPCGIAKALATNPRVMRSAADRAAIMRTLTVRFAQENVLSPFRPEWAEFTAMWAEV